jgi:hypothetical protein
MAMSEPATATPTDGRPDPAAWIDKFLTRYRRRFDPHDWPSDGDDWFEFVAGWVAAFRKHRVAEGEANAAAVTLAEYPPRYRNEHLPALLTLVRSNRPAADAPGRALAERARWRWEASVREAKGARLQVAWDALPEADRGAIQAAVEAENPGLARFEPFVRKLCLDRMRERIPS